jgi:hypothetical protein
MPVIAKCGFQAQEAELQDYRPKDQNYLLDDAVHKLIVELASQHVGERIIVS